MMTKRPTLAPGASTRLQCYSPDRKSTRLNSSHVEISYAVFCLKKKKKRLLLFVKMSSQAAVVRFLSCFPALFQAASGALGCMSLRTCHRLFLGVSGRHVGRVCE